MTQPIHPVLERVARALCKLNVGDEHSWNLWVDDARAAIQALRESTPQLWLELAPLIGEGE